MNVSSVKNLNGEVFSAVQDASLTNVVQTNSGNWQDITAYQSNSASYLTAHQDLSNYYTTADANTLSSMLSGAIDYVSANAGDEFPVSADEAIQYVQTNSGTIDDTVTSYKTNSATYLTAHQSISAEEWNSCYDNVNTNSGVWGGSALPISAGPGIDVQLANDVLVFSAVPNETVLWEGTAFTPAGSEYPTLTSVTLNESITNFNQIRLDFSGGNIFSESVVLSNPEVDENRWAWYNLKKEQSDNLVYIGTMYKFTNETTLSGKISYGDNVQNILAMTGGDWGYGGVCKVIGINRKQ